MHGLAKITSCLLAVYMMILGAGHAVEPVDVYGEWTPPDMDAVISIRNCGEVLCAELVTHDYTKLAAHDIKNPDPALRDRALLGVKILDGLRMTGRLKWGGGELYDPRTGKSYSSRVKILDSGRLKITGCISAYLCKGYIWTRARS